VRRFGAGLVISQMETAAVRLPRANSASGSAPIGLSRADSREASPVGQRPGRSGLENTVTEALWQVHANPSLPKGEIDFHHDHRTTN
jgi:hypothetical protein